MASRHAFTSVTKQCMTLWSLTYTSLFSAHFTCGMSNCKSGGNPYQTCQRVPLHVQSFQKLQSLIFQEFNRKIIQIPVIEKQILVPFLLCHKYCLMEFWGHGSIKAPILPSLDQSIVAPREKKRGNPVHINLTVESILYCQHLSSDNIFSNCMMQNWSLYNASPPFLLEIQ